MLGEYYMTGWDLVRTRCWLSHDRIKLGVDQMSGECHIDIHYSLCVYTIMLCC